MSKDYQLIDILRGKGLFFRDRDVIIRISNKTKPQPPPLR